jgi:hypothetical protein
MRTNLFNKSYADEIHGVTSWKIIILSLCHGHWIQTTLSYSSLPQMIKSNFPYYEKDQQAVDEHALHDKWKSIETVIYATMQCPCYCLPCMAITACANDSLIHINSLHIPVPVNYLEVCFMFSFTVLNWEWNIQLNSEFFCTIFMWKINCINCIKEGFAISIMVFRFHLHQRFSNWWTKWVFLRQKTHWTECCANQRKAWWNWNQIREIHLTNLTWLKSYVYYDIKLVRFQQLKKAITRGEHIFVTGFCGQYMQCSWPKTCISFTEEAWFHLSGYINAQNNTYGSNINLQQTSEVPLHDQISVWCAITATQTV